MINGLPIAQIPIDPAQKTSGQGVAGAAPATGISFEGLLGAILANGNLSNSADKVATGTAPETFELPSDLAHFLHSSDLIENNTFTLSAANSSLSGISGSLEQVLSLLNQISDRSLLPLEVVYDLEKLDIDNIGLPDALVQNISDDVAVVLIQESDLQSLLEPAARQTAEFSLPVLAVLNCKEDSPGPLSFVAAALTVRPPEADAGTENTASSGSNEVKYSLGSPIR